MTRFNNKYPYTDFHELNADWLLETVKDAEAEAKEASDTVATYNDRLTTVEGDLAPIKSAMPGIASSISDLTSGLGRVSSQVTTNAQDIADNAANIDNIEDRLTTYDQNFVNINNTFISDERRIGELEEYRTEAQVEIGNLGYSLADPFRPEQAYSIGDYVINDDTKRLYKAIVNIPAGTGDINNLSQFHPTAISSEVGANVLPTVTSADAGDVLTVDNNGDWVAATPTYEDLYIYSTTEKVIGTWTDNKPVYEKIITTPLPSTPNTSFLFAHNIADIENIIEYKAFMIFPNGTVHTFNDIQLDSGGIYSPAVSFLGVDKTNITIMCGMDRSTSSGRVFLRYTKTTD